MNEETEEIVIEEPNYTVAEVAGVHPDGLTLIFPGSEEASGKHYKCNADVVFHVGDRVKITKDGDTYIVDCVIGNPATPSSPGIPSGGLSGTFLGKNSGTDYDVSWKSIHEIPTGGSVGQVLAKKTATDYDTEWVNQSGVPTGGTAGQVLTKTSAASAWQDVPHEIPTGGANNQVLTKNGSTNYSVKWADAPEGLPTGGTTGQVLTKNSSVNYDVKWAAPTSSSAQSVSNYYSTSSAANTSYNIYFKTDSTYNPAKLYWRMGTSGTWHELS